MPDLVLMIMITIFMGRKAVVIAVENIYPVRRLNECFGRSAGGVSWQANIIVQMWLGNWKG
jgi:hypothetical protein